MTADVYPLQVLLVTLAGWVNRHQQHVIEYLVEENRVLKEQVKGRRLRLTDDQRRRLAAKGRRLGRRLFGAVTFVACVVYGLMVPRVFHASQLLEQILPGFRWLTLGSVLLGVGETFVYGAYAGFVFTLIHNTVLHRSQ